MLVPSLVIVTIQMLHLVLRKTILVFLHLVVPTGQMGLEVIVSVGVTIAKMSICLVLVLELMAIYKGL